MLTSGARLREWALFAALALAPASAMGAIGFRALRSEEAAARREAALSVDATADRLSGTIVSTLDSSSERLMHAEIPRDLAGAERALSAIAPPFSEIVVLDATRTLVVPAKLAHVAPSASAVPKECAPSAEAVERSNDANARATLLANCQEARSASGRWLWPMIALDPSSHASSEAIVAWIAGHASNLAPAEREATILEARSLAEPARSNVLRALDGPRSRHELVLARLQEVSASRALSDEGATISWRGDGSLGRLRRLADGRRVGFVVHAPTLTSWIDRIDRASAQIPDDLRLTVVTAIAPEVHADRPLGATVVLAPPLGIRVEPIDPHAVERHASRSRRILALVALAGVALASSLAVFLFARMRAARRSSELRTDFVSTVSHELRTPIASLRMLAELLEQGRVEDAERSEVHEALARESRRLGETVDRLLGFGRMAAGRYVVERKRASVDSAVAASIDAFEERFADMPKIERALAKVEASIDEGQIRLAVDNLLMNARKYAPDGTPYRVSVERSDGNVMVAVEDRGPGIRRSDQRRIFRAFERGDARLSRATEGTGIGLSLVRHVARAHGGDVSVESEPGKGARFIVTIPGAVE